MTEVVNKSSYFYEARSSIAPSILAQNCPIFPSLLMESTSLHPYTSDCLIIIVPSAMYFSYLPYLLDTPPISPSWIFSPQFTENSANPEAYYTQQSRLLCPMNMDLGENSTVIVCYPEIKFLYCKAAATESMPFSSPCKQRQGKH